MTKINTYEDAVNVLRSYDLLPGSLILPAYLVAFDEEYGRRPIVRGMVKHAVNVYENVLSIESTPNYEAVAITPRVSFWQDVETIAGHLERHPNNGKTAYYWEFTRQWYYDPVQIEDVLQRCGMDWVSLRKVKEAVKLFRGQYKSA